MGNQGSSDSGSQGGDQGRGGSTGTGNTDTGSRSGSSGQGGM